VKKVLISLVLGLAMVALGTAPALAEAHSVPLANGDSAFPGGGSVVFNGPAGNNQFDFELALKGAEPETAYDVYLDIPSLGVFGWSLGTITTSAAGNANLHHNCPISDTVVPLPPGPYDFGIRVRLAGSPHDLYVMSGAVIIK